MENVRDNELRAFLTYVIGVLERLDIPYMVVGGFAAILYGEPRLTIDVDIVADMRLHHLRPFVASFSLSEYYVSEEGIFDSLTRRYPFNVLQSTTGAKIDIVPLTPDLFTRAAFERRVRLPYDLAGHTAMFITAEDVILAKLIAHRKTESDKHLRDARGVLLMQWDSLDLAAIRRGAERAGLLETWEKLLAAAQRQIEGQEPGNESL